MQKLSDVQSQRLDAERDRAALESVKGRMEQGPELAQARPARDWKRTKWSRVLYDQYPG